MKKRHGLALLFFVFARLAWASDAKTAMTLEVDATDIARKIYHATLSIPVHPGPLVVVYPKWLYNAPVGSVMRMVGLQFTANGQSLPWHRNPRDMFAFQLEVPSGTTQLQADLDVLAATLSADGLGAVSSQLLVLEWHPFVLYPEGSIPANLLIHASVRLPKGWDHAGALKEEGGGERVDMPPVSMARLIDSPLIAGRHFKSIELPKSEGPPTFVQLAGESPRAIVLSDAWRSRFERLRAESGALFGEFPHDQYHFLITLSDELGNDGLEHRESSDIRLGADFFADENYRRAYGYLIPHEYAHAWNGISVRPRELATKDFQQEQPGSLLWIYEGLTRFLNWELAARSGVLSMEESRDYAALLAAKMDTRTGRRWRSLEDTAVSAQYLLFAPTAWQSQRRDADFYDEALLIWLEVDAKLRDGSGGKHQIDDFLRAFFRPTERTAPIKTYELSDVATALDRLAPGDWSGYFRRRLEARETTAPLDGLTHSGWTLTYDADVNTILAARDAVNHTIDERFSVGLLASEDGTILDVIGESSAWKAGLGPGMKIRKVNTRPFTPDGFRRAIAQDGQTALSLEMENGSDSFRTTILDRNGLRYPHLARGREPDALSELLRPRALAK
jgi:predicted metalloprotease with PDZ domain